eukprot:g67307.t1
MRKSRPEAGRGYSCQPDVAADNRLLSEVVLHFWCRNYLRKDCRSGSAPKPSSVSKLRFPFEDASSSKSKIAA